MARTRRQVHLGACQSVEERQAPFGNIPAVMYSTVGEETRYHESQTYNTFHSAILGASVLETNI
jgi:hypothetical protein